MRDGVAGDLIFDLSRIRSRNKCACRVRKEPTRRVVCSGYFFWEQPWKPESLATGASSAGVGKRVHSKRGACQGSRRRRRLTLVASCALWRSSSLPCGAVAAVVVAVVDTRADDDGEQTMSVRRDVWRGMARWVRRCERGQIRIDRRGNLWRSMDGM